jgi:hypothetical protein
MRVLSVLVIFCALLSMKAYGEIQERMALSLEEALTRAEGEDVELKSLRFSQGELVRSKKDIYRNFFPTVTTSLSGSNIVIEGEPDRRIYEFSVSLEQALYDQFATPIMLQNFDFSLEESRVNSEKRKKVIEQNAAGLYLEILLSEKRHANKREERRLSARHLELMREAYKVGMKTFLDLIETENTLLRVELELEELEAGNRILYKDLQDMLGLGRNGVDVVLVDDIQKIAMALFFNGGTGDDRGRGVSGQSETQSFDRIYERLLRLSEGGLGKDRLAPLAIRNDLELKKLSLGIRQNRLKQKLTGIQFLDSVSLGYQVDFMGERFFPANMNHTFSLGLELDFGLVSPEVSLSGSSAKSRHSRSESGESEMFGTLSLMGEGRALRFESFVTSEKIEERRRSVGKVLEVWSIKLQSLLKSYGIKAQQRDLFQKNDELFKLNLEIGGAAEVDYLDFLLKKNEFLIELETLDYDFIRLLWEIEGILNIKVSDLCG